MPLKKTVAISLLVAVVAIAGFAAGAYVLPSRSASPIYLNLQPVVTLGTQPPTGESKLDVPGTLQPWPWPQQQVANLLTISGTGEVKVKPDRVIIDLVISTEDDTAAEAVQKNAAAFNNLMTALKNVGIPEQQIETRWYNIFPVYQYLSSGESIITGYRAEHSLKVTIISTNTSELGAKAGQVIDAAVGAGVNQIQGIQFTVAEDQVETLSMQALELAVKAAKRKAELITNALGIQLTTVYSVSENVFYPWPIFAQRGFASPEEAKAASQIVPGAFSITAQVQVSYTIGPLAQQ